MQLGKQRDNESLQTQAAIRLAFVDAARGMHFQAIERLKAYIAGLQKDLDLREVQCVQARIAVWAGDTASLDGWEASLATGSSDVLPLQKENEAFNLARLRLAQGKPEQVQDLISPWQADAAEHGRVRSQVEAWCIEALAYYSAGDLFFAGKTLAKALSIGQAKGFRRLFLDEGIPMAALLQAVIPTLTQRPISLYATTLLYASSPGASPQPGRAAFVEPLSPQEIRVLRLVVARLSNSEIAQELVVSTNTVKTHLKSIYRKLNIASRQEARQVARELKLL